MADPNNIDDALKVGGGAGAVAVLAALGRFFSGAGTATRLEAQAAMLTQVQGQIAEMSAKLTIIVASLERKDVEAERLDAAHRLLALEERTKSMERSLEEVRATVKELSEGLVR